MQWPRWTQPELPWCLTHATATLAGCAGHNLPREAGRSGSRSWSPATLQAKGSHFPAQDWAGLPFSFCLLLNCLHLSLVVATADIYKYRRVTPNRTASDRPRVQKWSFKITSPSDIVAILVGVRMLCDVLKNNDLMCCSECVLWKPPCMTANCLYLTGVHQGIQKRTWSHWRVSSLRDELLALGSCWLITN